ncbi:MAG: hypothetical protein CMJ88_06180 [Planctomycetes bacterium]|nr:hypothetical protein [Planctomycetota bacterium]
MSQVARRLICAGSGSTIRVAVARIDLSSGALGRGARTDVEAGRASLDELDGAWCAALNSAVLRTRVRARDVLTRTMPSSQHQELTLRNRPL